MKMRSSPALQRYDENRNGRISCREAKRHRFAPVRKDHPAYQFIGDRDRDGVVCEGRKRTARTSQRHTNDPSPNAPGRRIKSVL